MANSYKGELALQRGASDLILLFDINAMCEIEEQLGLKPDAVVASFNGNMSLTVLRKLLWGALREHHPEIDLKECGRIIQELTWPVVAEKLGEAIRLSFPEHDPKATPASPQPPRKTRAAAGIGEGSTASGVN
ncbi:MAG: hypothetical protein Q8R82_12725 [Hyphomonadaceae bacterium]|nr:hypothetical protein [Hyphomonadaceae bacterium]